MQYELTTLNHSKDKYWFFFSFFNVISISNRAAHLKSFKRYETLGISFNFHLFIPLQFVWLLFPWELQAEGVVFHLVKIRMSASHHKEELSPQKGNVNCEWSRLSMCLKYVKGS